MGIFSSMIPAADTISKITLAHNTGIKFPGVMWSLFRAIHKIHRLWRWYRLKEVYTNQDNFLKLACGHTLNFVAGDKLVLKVAAQCVAISSRLLLCLEQKELLSLEFAKWKGHLKGEYPTPYKEKWTKNANRSLLSPSSKSFWRSNFKKLIEKIKIFVKRTFRLIKDFFVLSMRVMDTTDLFSLNPSVQSQCVNEFFVNTSKNIENLVENKHKLLQGLTENQKMIDQVLKGIGNPFSSKHLITVVKQTLDKTEKIHKAAEKASTSVGVFVKECFRKWAFEAASLFVSSENIPRSLVPRPENLPWNRPIRRKLKERCPRSSLMESKGSTLVDITPEILSRKAVQKNSKSGQTLITQGVY